MLDFMLFCVGVLAITLSVMVARLAYEIFRGKL